LTPFIGHSVHPIRRFAGTLNSFLPAFDSIAHQQQLAPGEVLFRQGEQASAIFAVAAGRVRLMRYTTEGVALTLHISRPGESFAEAALFSQAYHCDAIADLPSQVIVYPKLALLQVLQQQPQLAQEFIALLSHQVQVLRSRLELQNITENC
jgi:CRP-like cAMP-binding protein